MWCMRHDTLRAAHGCQAFGEWSNDSVSGLVRAFQTGLDTLSGQSARRADDPPVWTNQGPSRQDTVERPLFRARAATPILAMIRPFASAAVLSLLAMATWSVLCPSDSSDYASDAKDTKKVAREMLKMITELALGDTTQAAAALTKASELNPNDQQLKRQLDELKSVKKP